MPRSPAERRVYIDWARGIAVLLMIEAHTTDAWTRAADRTTIAFRDATILGGFAAPLFLWLAGLAVVMSATRTAERTLSRALAIDAICRRGLEIFILAFLFRLQAFILSPGSHPVMLFRADILNIMGPAIASAGMVWGLSSTASARVIAYAVLATAIALVTPITRTLPSVDALPTFLQWYVRPAGEHTTFTAFPWAGFVFAGGAVGALLAAARDVRAERRLHVALGVAGAALVAIGFYTASRPTIYRASSFWTSSPTWFAIRIGILMLALAAIYTCSALAGPVGPREGGRHGAASGVDVVTSGVPVVSGFSRTGIGVVSGFSRTSKVRPGPLARMGQSSLFIYWIHVELVYGYASWWWRGRLPLSATIAACALFSTVMYGAVVLRDRLVTVWAEGHRVPEVQVTTT